MEITLILFSVFIVLLLLGSPIAVALGLSAMATWAILGTDVAQMVQIAYTSVDSFPIMALPAFVLAGALMENAGISRRLVKLAETLAGPLTGGLGAATILACMFFGAISGSGPATTAAVGMLMIPAMMNRGYDKGYSAALVASSGGLGVVIPPSIPMVIYGVTGNQSISTMFLAGFLPGVLLAFSILICNYIIARKRGFTGLQDHWNVDEIFQAIKNGIWSILAPIVILGGIYTGMFTPTEAAIVAIFYTLLVGIFIHREVTFKGIFDSLHSTTWITGRVLIIMFAAKAFGRLLVEYRIPDVIAGALLALTSNVLIIWALIIIFLLFIGMFMETLATIMLVTPVLLPVMMQFGVDPIHFGVVLVVCCEIGFQTPPLGDNLFMVSGIADISIEEVSVNAIPFCIAETAAVFIIAYFPEISLWLPKVLGYIQ